METWDIRCRWITAILTAGTSFLLVWRNTFFNLIPAIELKFRIAPINNPDIYVLINHIIIIICIAMMTIGLISVYLYRRRVGAADQNYRVFRWMAWGNILLCSSAVFSW